MQLVLVGFIFMKNFYVTRFHTENYVIIVISSLEFIFVKSISGNFIILFQIITRQLASHQSDSIRERKFVRKSRAASLVSRRAGEDPTV